jgi:flagellar hook-associated protein 3 FlgL
MTFSSIGDLAQGFVSRRTNATLRQDLAGLTAELSTGRRADLPARLSGDFSALSGLSARLDALRAREVANAELALRAGAMQAALSTITGTTATLAADLALVSTAPDPRGVTAAAETARQAFGQIVGALNARVADRQLFSGTATDRPALAPAGDMLASLASATAGAPDAAALEAAVNDWFLAPGGGFELTGYLGGADPLPPAPLGDGSTADLGTRADDAALRGTLASVALAALVSAGALAGQPEERADALSRSAVALRTGEAGLVAVQAAVGTAEAAVEAATARNASEATATEIAIAGLTAADPFETATQLEEVRRQLETHYALTARLSRLTLLEFLR